MKTTINKAVIPIAGLATRFLPLSKVMPKELWPLADKPMIEYIIREAVDSGVNQIMLVAQPEKRLIADYFKKPDKKLEKILKKRKNNISLRKLEDFKNAYKNISFSVVLEKEALGDGHAVLQAKRNVGADPCLVLFADDIVVSKTPAASQLISVFKTCQRPIIALYRLPKEKLPSYGVVRVEKIANRIYKIKGIVEKPEPDKAPSDFAIVGKYVLTPEVFSYLKKADFNEKKEMILADVFQTMIRDGKTIYGLELEGEWLECGNVSSYLESNFKLSLNHQEYGPKIKKHLNLWR